MNFKKFMSAGLAAATGLTMAVAGTSAHAQDVAKLVYTSVGTIPILQLEISEDSTNSFYQMKLSTLSGTGFADYYMFAFDWEDNVNAPVLDLASVKVSNKDGSPLPTPTVLECTNNDRCGTGSANSTNLSGGANTNEGTKENGPWEFLYAFGGSGASGGLYDTIEFNIGVGAGNTNLSNGFPLSRLAARLQTTQNPDSSQAPQSPALGGDDSLKYAYTCLDNNCVVFQNTGIGVPEIDGPVLIQVGFALGGLYLLLLGRRRQEDELPQVA